MRVIIFERLNSDRAKIAALRIGYSPAIELPHRIPFEDGGYTNRWVLTGEAVCPVYSISNCNCYGSDFFEPNEGEAGYEGKEMNF
ncbi:hypothetical protein JYQ62_19605 [Nostoc sp. UHCC 0702]|nr:hypothetical protein JYQ62_19605 [Nostoc sp. UHCC 0702]